MTPSGIGRALRKARVQRGKTLEEASRETRIRAEYLQALEGEGFDELLGDVYVRGFLRSYSTYLGLDADKVLGYYAAIYGAPGAVQTPPARPAVSPDGEGLPGTRHRANWSLAVVVAGFALIVAAGVGLLSARSTPKAVDDAIPTNVSTKAPQTLTVQLAMTALRPVKATVIVDGKDTFDGTFIEGEARSWEGDRCIEILLGRGKAARLTVNHQALGTPGKDGVPYRVIFRPEDYRKTDKPKEDGASPACT